MREFGEEANCDWSPDDKQIVCSVYARHREKEGVYVQNVDGGGREFLVYGSSPRWNKDGSKIAFTDWRTVKLFDVASPTWRIIIVLARYGGLRCPSEVLSLEWRQVDWERNRVTVPSPKTDRYEGKESRTIPLFPELRTYLEDETGEIGGQRPSGGQA